MGPQTDAEQSENQPLIDTIQADAGERDIRLNRPRIGKPIVFGQHGKSETRSNG